MKIRPFLIAVFVFVVIQASPGRAQFYAPDVFFHDTAQRLFAIEALRVMATGDAADASITWSVEGKLDGATQWTLRITDAAPPQVVSYEAAALDRGADFYREVWRHLREKAADPSAEQTPQQGEELQALFWPDPARDGVSRMALCRAAMNHATSSQPWQKAADAVRLAGLLAHASCSKLTGACALDSLLLARSAAWLCRAEELSGQKLDRAWAVIEYLAGREMPARALWQSIPRGEPITATIAKWWDLVLSEPYPSLDRLALHAAEPGQAAWGLYFLVAQLEINMSDAGETGAILSMLYGPAMEGWHDALPSLTRRMGVSGLRGPITRSPQMAREDWLKTMALAAQNEARPDLTARAEEGLRDLQLGGSAVPSCDGLKACAEWIQNGVLVGKDSPLKPVAAVTLADLEVYGWDMTAETFLGYFEFLERQFGDQETAAEVRRSLSAALPELEPWLKKVTARKAWPQDVPLERLEYFETNDLAQPLVFWPFRDEGQPNPPPPSDPPWGPAARNWLRRGRVAYWHQVVLNRTPIPEMTLLAYREKLLAQAGEGVVASIYGWGFTLADIAGKNEPEWLALNERLAAACPNAFPSHRSAILYGPGADIDPFKTTCKLEELFWKSPNVRTCLPIYLGYLRVGAFQAAKRFYTQSAARFGHSMEFSNVLAPSRWVIAWWEKDEPGMEAAANEARSFSAIDIMKHLHHLLAKGDDAQAASLLNAAMQRYPAKDKQSSDTGLFGTLHGLMPLLPALADPQHDDHTEALAYFTGSSYWLTLRLVLARRFDFSDPETRDFIACDETSSTYIRAFEGIVTGDLELLEKTATSPKFWSSSTSPQWGMDRTLLALAYRQLAGHEDPGDPLAHLPHSETEPLVQRIQKRLMEK